MPWRHRRGVEYLDARWGWLFTATPLWRSRGRDLVPVVQVAVWDSNINETRFWLQIQRSRVRSPALPDFLSSSGSGTRSTQPREVNWGATGIRCADHVTPLYPQKLALTSPTGGGCSVGIVRSRTKATEFSFRLFRSGPSVLLHLTGLHSAFARRSLWERCCLYIWVDPEDEGNIFLGFIAHLRQECHNSKSVIFQKKILKVLKCYNFLWVQRRHNCSPAESFANCFMTLYLLKVHLQTFYFYTNNSKMPNFELWQSCRK
jgi:hypothetical protein